MNMKTDRTNESTQSITLMGFQYYDYKKKQMGIEYMKMVLFSIHPGIRNVNDNKNQIINYSSEIRKQFSIIE